jgi:hypothetical protein
LEPAASEVLAYVPRRQLGVGDRFIVRHRLPVARHARDLRPVRFFDAAIGSVAREADPAEPGAALLPDVKNLRALSAVVAQAVYAASHADGVATKTPDNVVHAIADIMWQPAYDRAQCR